jgi:oligopeptide transport system substrate-binding protein
LTCVALFLALAGCAKRETATEAGVRTKTLLVGNNAEPTDLDPHVITSATDGNLMAALFEGLTVADEKSGQPLPAVAERWEISPDGLVYTFHLRASAKWSNGDPVTSADFAYSFQRLISPGLASEYSYMLWPIKNAEAFNGGKIKDFSAVGVATPNPSTLQLTLERPVPYLLALAAHNTWMPVHRATIEKFGRIDQRGTAWTRAGNLVGNGAFTLTEWTPNARIVVKRNPQYWDNAHTQLESVVFFPIESGDTEERIFRAGQLHATYDVPTTKIATYRDREPQKLRVDLLLNTWYLNFNTTKPPLDNLKVRRALALAVDREALAQKVLNGSRLPAYFLTPPDCGGYTARAKMPTDIAAAKKLLEEAGFPGGKGLPVFELQVQNDIIQPKAAEAIQAMWRTNLGVEVKIAPLEKKIWLQNQQTKQHTIGLMSWIADFPDPATFLETFTGTSGNNWTGWSNPEYDKLIQQAATTLDQKQRFEYFQQAEALILEQAPLAPIYFGTRTYLINPAVKNYQPAILGTRRYQVIELAP